MQVQSLQLNAYAANLQRIWWAEFLDAELMARDRRDTDQHPSAAAAANDTASPAPRLLPDQPARPNA